jgi:hypothetical protein
MVLGSSLYFLVAPTSGRLNHPTSDTRKFVFYPSVARDQRVFSQMLTCWSLGITPAVKVRNDDYRDSNLNKSVYYMNTNERLSLVVLAALPGAAGVSWSSSFQQGQPSSVEERGVAAGCCLTVVYIQKYTLK